MSDTEMLSPEGSEPSRLSPMRKNQDVHQRTPEIKVQKSVSFADSKGKQLVDVKKFVSSSDFLLDSLGEDLNNDVLSCLQDALTNRVPLNSKWITCFKGPDPDSHNHISYVHEKKVVFEKLAIVADPSGDSQTLEGGVRVANVAYQKNVYVRATYHNWATYFEVDAIHHSHCNGSNTDLFTFKVPLKKEAAAHTRTMEFVVAYQVGGATYWDNNNFLNYRIYQI